MALIELKMPALGEGIIEATVLKWLKQPGEQVEEEEMVLEIATDKVDSEVPSTVTGVIKELLFKENDIAPVGATIALIEAAGESATASTDQDQDNPTHTEEKSQVQVQKQTDQEPQSADIEPDHSVPYVPAPVPVSDNQTVFGPATSSTSPGNNNEAQGNNGFYSPLVMSIAAKEGLSPTDLATIPGTGNEGRLTKKDLLTYLEKGNNEDRTTGTATTSGQTNTKNAASSIGSPVAFSGETEVIEMDRMRKLIAKHMKESQHINATVTSFAEVDVTNMVKWRESIKKDFEAREKTKITFTPLFIDCVVRVIKRFPLINSSVDGDTIILKKSINIGMATALPNGNLIVPVIKNADHLNLVGLSKSVNDLANRARNNKLKPADTQEGTFTLTNVGSFGSLGGTPIINQPQVAILAIGTIKKRPVVIETAMGDTIGIRHIMILSLSYDHRIIDGSMGSLFLDGVVKEIENWDPNKKY